MHLKNAKKLISWMLVSVLLLYSGGEVFAAKDNTAAELITDIIYSYKVKGIYAQNTIDEKLAELKQIDSELGDVWQKTMNYWIYANSDQTANADRLPEGMPDDDSFCIIVLGFKLEDDGSMNLELKKRCDVAVTCANQYPKAYIAVTGGGTAAGKKDATEADVMAEYLIQNGVNKDRIIIENQSESTVENAKFLGDILLNQYPSVTSAAIVTTDYHVPLGSFLFREFFMLSNYKNGTRIIEILSNAAYASTLLDLGETVSEQAVDLIDMADYFGITGQ